MKYTIQQINNRKDILVYIDSRKEFNKLKKAGLKLVSDYSGKHLYSPFNRNYTSSSSLTKLGDYKTDNIPYIIITFKDIIMNTEEKTYPRVMLVNDENNINTANKRVVFAKKCGKYLAWINAETIEEAEKETGTFLWNYAWEIEEKSIFPFSLSPKDAQRIIDVACGNWKTKLANLWANNIVLNENIEISEKYYNEMYKACTDVQKELFNQIFK